MLVLDNLPYETDHEQRVAVHVQYRYERAERCERFIVEPCRKRETADVDLRDRPRVI